MLDPNMENEPELMLPCNIDEEVFDILFIQAHALLNSMDTPNIPSLAIEELTNLVADILRVYDIYELYKENMAGLVVMYASWIILESLQRSQTIKQNPTNFESLFDNDSLMLEIQRHQAAFEKTIQTIILT